MFALNRPSHRLIGLAATASLALALGLAGCQQGASDDARVAELEQQVEDLQKQLDEKSGTSATQGSNAAANASTGAADGSASATATVDEGLSAELTAAYPELADFEDQVADLVVTCQNVQVSSDRNANYQTFIGVKQQIEAVEHAMDNYDENQEAAARTGSLSYEEYMKIERAVDYLDERLDRAKDGMEFALGIDD